MSERNAVARSGQYRPRVTGASSVQMEDRNVLRRMERERRSQEVQQEKTEYDRITPLFSEPFKRIKGDELSSRIQSMLGNYEDGSDELPHGQLPVDGSKASLLDGSRAAPASASGSVPPPGESWDRLPALCPPADPLSPLQSSDSDGGASPERSSHRPDVPPLTLPLNLHCKLANAKKPTAYVRPMDGQDQVTSDSPQLKASPEHVQDLKESSKPILPPLQSVDEATFDSVRLQIVSGARVDDILQEMTSWPPLLTTICTPSTAEPLRLLSNNEESHGFTALKAHESSDGVQLEPQGSSSSSDSDSSSDIENNSSTDQPAAHEPSHTQTQKGSDWQLGRWLETKENQHQQNPESPSDVIHPNSHDSAGRTEAAGQQGCYSNPIDSGKATDRRQTVGSTYTCENLLLGSTCVEISQRVENASKRRSKHKREKTARDAEQKKTTTTDTSKQTDGKQPLLVKIQLNLLSRIPREPKAGRSRTSLTSGRKRAAERDEKPPKKKQKLDKEGKQSFSSQHSLHQSEADTAMMKKKRKSTKHGSGLSQEGHKPRSAAAPDGQQRAETHGKKPCKSCPVLPEEPRPPVAEARAPLPADRRQRSVEDHMKEAKKLKHKADATPDKTAKALIYLEAALAFVESAVAMETEPQTPKSAYTMFSETLDLIRFILKLKNYTDLSAAAHERDFYILCLRCQSLLQMAMFRYRRDSALRYSRTLADHFRSSSWSASPSVSKSSVASPVSSAAAGGSLVIPQSIQQAAASYVSITALFLSAHEMWEQADDLTHSGSGLLRELDSAVGPLSLTASMSSLVTYVRHGLRWIRRDTQNSR